MFTSCCPLILASASPRRRQLLARLGLAFTVCPADIDETPLAGESPLQFARRMAAEKAGQVARLHPEACVLAADTVVALQETIFGKPADQAEAVAILGRLQGQTHEVITGYALIAADRGVETVAASVSRVTFGRFAEPILRAYASTGEPMDKAGAYGIQGIGTFLVKEIQGSCSNVIGLPVQAVLQELLRHQLLSVDGAERL